MLLLSRTQGSSPGLRDNGPLALKEDPEFCLGFSISSKARIVNPEDRVTIFTEKSKPFRISWVAFAKK